MVKQTLVHSHQEEETIDSCLDASLENYAEKKKSIAKVFTA